MSQVPQVADTQERQPLLQPNDTSNSTPFLTSTAIVDVNEAGSSASEIDRLQHHRAMVRDRFSVNWWLEWIIILVVFSVTGSSTMLIVRPLMKALGLNGSLGAGPWSFRIAYIVLTLPLYSCMLLLISSLVCRRPYFENLLIRMWDRLLPRYITNKFQRREPAA
ncbi:hypothetical protein BC939DRAFT_435046 [Gamsiella multidivaricata]|uniref:uncharacterized protein n=1 Tax=Gamsiella multidivaricata TaxID=101098 RepID=UPI002220B3B4|nr:uncharacterized protein BC939DRAFT_435046 [Gamsiella multidivaricata]KAI7832268.1 hypothetical protein BC939DRAFT_435046 [Gamsiella multidivaricata]